MQNQNYHSEYKVRVNGTIVAAFNTRKEANNFLRTINGQVELQSNNIIELVRFSSYEVLVSRYEVAPAVALMAVDLDKEMSNE